MGRRFPYEVLPELIGLHLHIGFRLQSYGCDLEPAAFQILSKGLGYQENDTGAPFLELLPDPDAVEGRPVGGLGEENDGTLLGHIQSFLFGSRAAGAQGILQPEFPVSNCLVTNPALSSTRAMVVPARNTVKHPLDLTKSSLLLFE